MTLKAMFQNGKASIIDLDGNTVMQFDCKDEAEGLAICSNKETRQAILSKFNILSFRLEWSEPKTEENPIIRDVEIKHTHFEEKIKGMIFDLEQSDEKISIEKNNHRLAMQDLTKQQEDIKSRLYKAQKGKIMEPVKCKVIMDYKSGMKQIVRTDTGEIIEEVELTTEELQTSVFPEDKESLPPKPKRKKKVSKDQEE